MKNIIACNLASYGKYGSRALEHLASLGVLNVECPVPAPEDVSRLAGDLAVHGMKATSLMADCDLSSDAGIESMRRQVEAAAELGTTLLFVSCKAGETPRAEALARLRRMGDVAAERGITLAVETHPDLAQNGTVASETMRAVNHPNVGINYDTGNVYYYNRDVNGIEELKKELEWVVSVHLKDTNGGYETWYFPALGEGIVDYPEVFRLLNDRGFHGPFTMELEGIQGESLTEEQQLARVAKSVEYLRSIGAF